MARFSAQQKGQSSPQGTCPGSGAGSLQDGRQQQNPFSFECGLEFTTHFFFFFFSLLTFDDQNTAEAMMGHFRDELLKRLLPLSGLSEQQDLAKQKGEQKCC